MSTLEQLIPMVSSLNGTMKASTLSESFDRDSEICEVRAAQIIVESPHPYKANTVHSLVSKTTFFKHFDFRLPGSIHQSSLCVSNSRDHVKQLKLMTIFGCTWGLELVYTIQLDDIMETRIGQSSLSFCLETLFGLYLKPIQKWKESVLSRSPFP